MSQNATFYGYFKQCEKIACVLPIKSILNANVTRVTNAFEICDVFVRIFHTIRDFNGHLPYPFQNPISNFYLSLEAGKSSTDSVILRKLTNVEIIFRAWTKSLKRTKMYFDD